MHGPQAKLVIVFASVPGGAVVAQGTLNPLTQVRPLAGQLQIRQFLRFVERYNLKLEDEE